MRKTLLTYVLAILAFLAISDMARAAETGANAPESTATKIGSFFGSVLAGPVGIAKDFASGVSSGYSRAAATASNPTSGSSSATKSTDASQHGSKVSKAEGSSSNESLSDAETEPSLAQKARAKFSDLLASISKRDESEAPALIVERSTFVR